MGTHLNNVLLLERNKGPAVWSFQAYSVTASLKYYSSFKCLHSKSYYQALAARTRTLENCVLNQVFLYNLYHNLLCSLKTFFETWSTKQRTRGDVPRQRFMISVTGNLLKINLNETCIYSQLLPLKSGMKPPSYPRWTAQS